MFNKTDVEVLIILFAMIGVLMTGSAHSDITQLCITQKYVLQLSTAL